MTEPEIVEAAGAGNLSQVRDLLRSDPQGALVRGAHEKTALHHAAEHNHVGMAEALLAAGADLEARTDWGMTALDWAATLGNRQVVELLLTHGARTSLYTEAGLGRLDAVALAADAQDEAALSHAFQVACRNGHTAVARYLLERGARIDHPGYFDAPGLHWAAINGHADTVQFLLEHGADPTIRDSEFDADAYAWARESGNDEVIALLSQRS